MLRSIFPLLVGFATLLSSQVTAAGQVNCLEARSAAESALLAAFGRQRTTEHMHLSMGRMFLGEVSPADTPCMFETCTAQDVLLTQAQFLLSLGGSLSPARPLNDSAYHKYADKAATYYRCIKTGVDGDKPANAVIIDKAARGAASLYEHQFGTPLDIGDPL